MTETSRAAEGIAPNAQVTHDPSRSRALLERHTGIFLIVWTVLALGVFWQYDLANHRLDADASFMLYAGQQILRGHAPYIGVTIVKLPLSPFVAAAGIAGGRLFGLDDILGGRIAFWLCAGLTVGAVYLIGAQLVPHTKGSRARATRNANVLGNPARALDHDVKNSRISSALLGSSSAAVLLSFQALAVQVAEGPEAKLPMICAGMFCLVLLARRQFLGAGITGAFAFLAWQPGLIFVAAALFCALIVPNRKRAFVVTLLGSAVPLLLMGAYLAWQGALGSMWHQAFGANVNYLEEKKVAVGIFGVVVGNLAKVWDVSQACSATEIPLIGFGYIGMIGGAAFLIARLWRNHDVQDFLNIFPLLLSGAGLFAFSFLDLQKCSDLVPLLPYLALGAGGLFLVSSLFVSRLKFQLAQSQVLFAVGGIALALVLLYGALDAFTLSHSNFLVQQRALANEIAARLQPDDRVQQFGDTVLLVVTRRENTTRFVHLGEKQGLGILTAEGVTIADLIAQLQVAQPRVITLSRAKTKDWAQPLYDWIAQNYTLHTSYGFAEGGTLKDTDVWWKK